MCDKELLVSYIYDELHGAERKAFQHHLASCLSCREEVQALRATRGHLGSWTPPEQALGFTLPAPERGRTAARLRAVAWPLAAAAALLLAVGSVLANVDISVSNGGMTIRAGAARDASAAAAPSVNEETRQALAGVQQRVRELEALLAAQAAADTAPVAVSPAAHTAEGSRVDEAALLRRVQKLIEESEGRQQQRFAVRLMQIVRELQAEHTMDLVRIEQSFNQHQAVSSDEIFRQREEMKQLYRLANQQR
jgi:hypothetical protein